MSVFELISSITVYPRSVLVLAKNAWLFAATCSWSWLIFSLFVSLFLAFLSPPFEGIRYGRTYGCCTQTFIDCCAPTINAFTHLLKTGFATIEHSSRYEHKQSARTKKQYYGLFYSFFLIESPSSAPKYWFSSYASGFGRILTCTSCTRAVFYGLQCFPIATYPLQREHFRCAVLLFSLRVTVLPARYF